MIEGSDVLIAFLGIHGSHLIQDFGEIGHQYRYGLLQQCIGDAGSRKGLTGSYISPKQKAKVFSPDLSPVLHIIFCPTDRIRLLSHIEPPVQKMAFLNACGFQTPDGIHPFSGFILFLLPAHLLLPAFAGAGKCPHLPKEFLPALHWCMTVSAVKQTILPQVLAFLRHGFCFQLT